MIKHTHLTILHQLYLSETQPFRKVHRMIDLFESIIKTHTVIILSAYVQHNKLSDSAKGLLAQGLRTPSLGTWQLFSRVLFEELQKDNYGWILNDFANEFISLDKALNIDKTNVVAFRNGYAHGATPSDAQCEADIKKFDSFLKQLMESKWLAQSSLEVQDGKVLIATSNGTLSLHPMFLFRKEASDASFAFFNDFKNDKIGLLNYPLSKHYKEKDFFTEFQEYLPLNEWKKTGNNEFYQRIEELTETFKGRTIEREKLLQFVLKNHKGYFSIQGNPGIGKSALIAQFFKDLRTHSELKKLHVVEYFIRRGTQQAQVEYMFNYLIRRTDELFSAGKEIRAEGKMVFDLQNQLFAKWRLWGEQSSGQHLLFLIDGLDEGVENNIVTYLPRENFENILIIYGSRPGGHKSIDDLWATLPLENHTKLELSGLGKEDIRALIYEVANKYELERESSWIDAVQKRSQGNPLYLKLLCDAIENGNIEINDINALPEKIDEYYKAILNRYAHDTLDGDALLNGLFTFAAAKDYLTIPHLGLINKLGSASIQRIGSTLKEVLYENPLTEEVLDYQLFHESFREYLVKEKIKEVNDAAGRIIDFCATWQELEGSWEQRYALKHFSTHLYEAKTEKNIVLLLNLLYDKNYYLAQIEVLKEFNATRLLFEHSLKTAAKLGYKEKVLYAAEKLKELHFSENDSLNDLLNYGADDKSELVLSKIKNIDAITEEDNYRKSTLYIYLILNAINLEDNQFSRVLVTKIMEQLSEDVPAGTNNTDWKYLHIPAEIIIEICYQLDKLKIDFGFILNKYSHFGYLNFYLKSETSIWFFNQFIKGVIDFEKINITDLLLFKELSISNKRKLISKYLKTKSIKKISVQYIQVLGIFDFIINNNDFKDFKVIKNEFINFKFGDAFQDKTIKEIHKIIVAYINIEEESAEINVELLNSQIEKIKIKLKGKSSYDYYLDLLKFIMYKKYYVSKNQLIPDLDDDIPIFYKTLIKIYTILNNYENDVIIQDVLSSIDINKITSSNVFIDGQSLIFEKLGVIEYCVNNYTSSNEAFNKFLEVICNQINDVVEKNEALTLLAITTNNNIFKKEIIRDLKKIDVNQLDRFKIKKNNSLLLRLYWNTNDLEAVSKLFIEISKSNSSFLNNNFGFYTKNTSMGQLNELANYFYNNKKQEFLPLLEKAIKYTFHFHNENWSNLFKYYLVLKKSNFLKESENILSEIENKLSKVDDGSKYIEYYNIATIYFKNEYYEESWKYLKISLNSHDGSNQYSFNREDNVYGEETIGLFLADYILKTYSTVILLKNELNQLNQVRFKLIFINNLIKQAYENKSTFTNDLKDEFYDLILKSKNRSDYNKELLHFSKILIENGTEISEILYIDTLTNETHIWVELQCFILEYQYKSNTIDYVKSTIKNIKLILSKLVDEWEINICTSNFAKSLFRIDNPKFSIVIATVNDDYWFLNAYEELIKERAAKGKSIVNLWCDVKLLINKPNFSIHDNVYSLAQIAKECDSLEITNYILSKINDIHDLTSFLDILIDSNKDNSDVFELFQSLSLKDEFIPIFLYIYTAKNYSIIQFPTNQIVDLLNLTCINNISLIYTLNLYKLNSLFCTSNNKNNYLFIKQDFDLQWAVDIASKMRRNVNAIVRSSKNVIEWLHEFTDEDDKEQVLLWAKQVSKGKISEQDFLNQIKDIVKNAN